jgi:hypothetical protein
MSARGCSRSWQAEAALDGRLPDADARSFERHVATCDACRNQAQALSELQQVAARLPTLASTPLEQRRQRNELLRRANAIALRPPRASRPVLLALAAAIASVIAAFLLWRQAPSPPARLDAPAASRVPTFELTASPNAEWRTLERSQTLRLSVQRGRFELSVDKLHQGQRFLLDLPDGELEVHGTRFVVDVEPTRTTSVRVLEGRVALRLHHDASRSLGPGDHWEVAPAVSAPPALPKLTGSRTVTTAAAPPSALSNDSPQLSSASTPATPASAPATPASAPEPPAPAPLAPAPSALTPPASGDFTLAMSAFSAGDYGRADTLFASFERLHPTDARVEDALFLRAVARSRRGDAKGAAVIAREFLRRYPNALRRADAERLK